MNKTSKERLKQLELNHLKSKYPNVQESYLPLTKWNDAKANDLTKAIVAFINFSGGFAERINTMGTYKMGAKLKVGDKVRTMPGKYIPSGSTKGSADISSTIPVSIKGVEVGISVKWEVKIGKDRQSEAQKKYEENTNKSGGYYFIVKDFEDFLQKYDALKDFYS